MPDPLAEQYQTVQLGINHLCVRVCVYAYVCTRMCVRVCVYAHVCTRMCVRVCVYA